MMRPQTLLSLLCVGAVIVGSQLYLKKHVARAANSASSQHPDTQLYIAQLEKENTTLHNNNKALKRLLENDDAVQLDPALITFVEKNLHLSFASPPVVSQHATETLQESAAQLWFAAFGETGIQMRTYVFGFLGIVPYGQNFIHQCITAETLGAIGVYDYGSKEITLSESFDSENVHHQASVIRLLGIALLEQHYPLPKKLTDDQLYSHIGITRARASKAQDKFYTLQARHNGFIAEALLEPETIKTYNQSHPYVKEIIEFGNTYAKDFLAHFKTPKAIANIFTDQTLSTYDIYTQKIQQTPAFTELTDDNTQLSTQLGFITVRGFLRQIKDQDLFNTTIQKIQPHYLSDHLSIHITDEQIILAQWHIQFATNAAAQLFYDHAKSLTQSSKDPPNITLKGSEIRIQHNSSFTK